MKGAAEIINFMAAYPGKVFTKRQITKGAWPLEPVASRKGIHLIMQQLEKSGVVEIKKISRTRCLYIWKING